MTATYNLCNRLIDIGKGDIVDANIDLYLANNRLTEEAYTALMERPHPAAASAESRRTSL